LKGKQAMKTYKTLKEVVEAVRSGELNESKLAIVMDNDCSTIYNGMPEDKEGNEIDNTIYKGKGYEDTEDLWPLLFPKATVGWC